MNIEHLWEQFHDPLKGFVLKRIPPHYAADDIVQDVFVKIATHIDTLKDEDKVQVWIYQITRNAIRDYYRKQRPTEKLPIELEAESEFEEDFSEEISACIRPMINRLPDKYREAIELTELKGMTQKELSEQLGISFSGAKSRVQRGREKLKGLLTACCHIEADRYGNIIDFQKDNSQDDQNCPVDTCGCN